MLTLLADATASDSVAPPFQLCRVVELARATYNKTDADGHTPITPWESREQLDLF